ncbi:MAG: EAL domain-containing protein [Pseudomonadota bacterium]
MATRAAKAQEPSKAFFSSALQEDIEARFALQQSREAGFDPGVFSVNVSAEQLRLPGLAQEVIAAARDHRIEPRCLELEITETAFISQATEHVERNVRALRQHGFTVALDDFGTGSPP